MAVQTGTVQVVMPAMGDSVSEGTVLEWHKHEGDAVAADETLVEISTDKVDAEVPAPVGGTVAVGQVIARMSAGAAAPSQSAPAPSPAGTSAPAETAPAETAPAAPPTGNGANVSPVAQRIAAAEGVDLAGVAGTARGGRIT